VVCSGFGSSVRVPRIERIGLGEPSFEGLSVHLVGGDLDESIDVRVARRIKQRLRSLDVGRDERFRSVDRAIDVGLRSEIHDDVGTGDEFVNEVPIANVPVNELVTRIVQYVLYIRHRARVGQSIEREYGVTRVGEDVSDEIGANEASSTGY
jgi:hypothetical protein